MSNGILERKRIVAMLDRIEAILDRIEATQDLSSPISSWQQVYTIPEACKALRVSKSTVYRMAKRGKVKPYQMAGKTVFRKEELERLMEWTKH